MVYLGVDTDCVVYVGTAVLTNGNWKAFSQGEFAREASSGGGHIASTTRTGQLGHSAIFRRTYAFHKW